MSPLETASEAHTLITEVVPGQVLVFQTGGEYEAGARLVGDVVLSAT
jgi:hypothetical protein